jgi:hypothetical protein
VALSDRRGGDRGRVRDAGAMGAGGGPRHRGPGVSTPWSIRVLYRPTLYVNGEAVRDWMPAMANATFGTADNWAVVVGVVVAGVVAGAVVRAVRGGAASERGQ